MEKATIATVARQAQVSRQTVSNVLNAPHLVRGDTRERVLEAIDALGYRASQTARQMRTGRSRLVAVRIEPTRDGINGSVLDRFLHSLTETAAGAGYRVVLYTAAGDDDEIGTYEELLAAYQLDGFVLTSTHYGDSRTAWLAAHDVPFVTFGRPWGRGPEDNPHRHPWVDVDGAAGTAAATRHLLDQGHERIGFIGWPEGSGVGDDRRSGWSQIMLAAGHYDATLARATPDGTDEGAAAAADLLDQRRPPTAIVCASDSLALGAMRESNRSSGGGNPATPTPKLRGKDQPGGHGNPSGRVAVTGFDDTPVAAAVGLTSISQPLSQVAAECMNLLARLLAGTADRSIPTHNPGPTGATADHVLLAPDLVIRDPAFARLTVTAERAAG